MNRRLTYLAWGALVYNLAVILWGAVVRITGAGAGCGDHWPLCDGQVVPLSFTAERVIEFSHRLTSGGSGLLAMGLFALAFAAPMRQAVTHPELAGRVRLSFVAGLVGAALLVAGAVSAAGSLVLWGAGLGLLALLGWLTALLSLRQLSWAETFRRWPVVFGAALSFGLILLEGVVGGLQVLWGLTADSADPARGLVQGVHLANTFALLGALLLTALWAGGSPALWWTGRRSEPHQKQVWGLWSLGLLLTLLVGMAGAVTALGDLLFTPAPGTPLDTVRRDFGPAATLIENLRVVHPVLALVGSGYLLWMAARLRQLRPGAVVNRWAGWLSAAIAVQVVAGFLNVALKAPDWMQLAHLLLACIMWLMTVMLGYTALTLPEMNTEETRTGQEMPEWQGAGQHPTGLNRREREGVRV
ncbi:COX15/CtaA family protein [Deinococcus piscis]|nr:COX15/CtaA family protein [Deinococcus piscis]